MLSTKAKIRIARVLNLAIVGARSVVGRPAVADVRRFGLNWQLDLNEGIDLAIYLGRYQNLPKGKLQQWLPPGCVAIDIGANIGAHCLRMARQVGPLGRVVGIEPTDYAFAKISANARLNPEFMPRLVLVQAALADKAEGEPHAAFYSRWPLRGSALGRQAQHLGELEPAGGARVVTLDALIAELRGAGRISGRVAFIKLDVDGNELAVLRGGGDTLTRDRPLVLVEIAPYVQDAIPGRFEELIETLEGFGYRLEDPRSQRPLPMSAAELRQHIRSGASIDALAKPVA